jgi:hypothetical protein
MEFSFILIFMVIQEEKILFYTVQIIQCQTLIIINAEFCLNLSKNAIRGLDFIVVLL